MTTNNLNQEIADMCEKAKKASYSLAASSSVTRDNALKNISEELRDSKAIQEIIEKNELDIKTAREMGLSESMIDRLTLDEKRIKSIADALIKIVNLPDPLGKGDSWTRPNGLKIGRVSVPLGVCGMIYESRPNVTVDAAVLCIKSGNAVILRGGKEAINSNRILTDIIKRSIAKAWINPDVVELINDTTRESSTILMKQNGKIDVLIPRGGISLIKSVVENATVPVIETGAGNCHIYVDDTADFEMAANVIYNAKTRPSVCNSVETVLISSKIYKEFLPVLSNKLRDRNVEFRGCERVREVLKEALEATEDDYYKEYNDFILALKVVDSLDEAIEHINKYNTKHSEAIITSDISRAREFQKRVDAAAVYVNASTWFTDGEEFGFGAEIGISTSKLHARGPVGLTELTTIKYLIEGNGTIRV
jgi:glutamate-5-semialdehyde dehydrogenase